jgi:hypothetical protein
MPEVWDSFTMRIALLVLACLLVWHPALAQDQHVLFLGNSYTAGNDLASIADAWLEMGVTAWPDVRVERNTPGGYRLPQHLADAQGANGQVAAWLTPGAEPWNTVILQDQSQVPGFYSTTPVWVDSRDAAIELHTVVGATGADTMLFLTWGRRVGDDTNPELYANFTAMQDRLTDGYLAYALAAATDDRPVFIAPVGEAFRLVHDQILADDEVPTEQGSLFWDLYVGDGSHPSELGSYLAAAVFYAALTGRSPIGVEAPPFSVDGERQEALQQAAHDAVLAEPFGAFRYPWAWDATDWPAPTDVGATADLVVSGVGVLPLVRTGDADIASILVGAAHGGDAGSGRLLVDGTLTSTSITLAEAEGSEAEVQVDGALTVADLRAGAGTGAIQVSGDLTVTGAIEPPVLQDGGTVTPGTSMTDWTMSAGVAAFPLTTGRATLEASGAVSLAGTVQVTASGDVTEAILVSAPTLDVSAATIELPDGWSWDVQADGGLSQLMVSAAPIPPADNDDTTGCGCAQDDSGGSQFALLLGLAMVAGPRRRRTH